MIKLENAWREISNSDDLVKSDLAKSGLKAFNRKMKELFVNNQSCLTIIRCAAYLDPAICGILEKVCQVNSHWGKYDTVFIFFIQLLIFQI